MKSGRIHTALNLVCYLWEFFPPDINECATQSCHHLAHCTNTIGSYSCRCRTGFTGNGHHCTGLGIQNRLQMHHVNSSKPSYSISSKPYMYVFLNRGSVHMLVWQYMADNYSVTVEETYARYIPTCFFFRY